MGKIILVLGGAKSGKTTFALKTATRFKSPYLYLATAEARDDEMEKRIARHQAERGLEWVTAEEPIAVKDLLDNLDPHKYPVILFDCVTLWLSNLLALPDQTDEKIVSQVRELVDAAKKTPGSIIFVSNEVGQGIVPDNELARTFRDLAGQVNQIIAGSADEVYFTIAGLAQKIK